MERTIRLPDLDLPGVPIKVVAWLVRVGDSVLEGDRVLELLAGEVSFELDAPISGILVEQMVAVEEAVLPHQELGRIRSRG